MALWEHSGLGVGYTKGARDVPLIGYDDRACRDSVTVPLVLILRAMRYAGRDDSMPSHHLFDDCVDVREGVSVSKLGEPVGSDDSI